MAKHGIHAKLRSCPPQNCFAQFILFPLQWQSYHNISYLPSYIVHTLAGDSTYHSWAQAHYCFVEQRRMAILLTGGPVCTYMTLVFLITRTLPSNTHTKPSLLNSYQRNRKIRPALSSWHVSCALPMESYYYPTNDRYVHYCFVDWPVLLTGRRVHETSVSYHENSSIKNSHLTFSCSISYQRNERLAMFCLYEYSGMHSATLILAFPFQRNHRQIIIDIKTN